MYEALKCQCNIAQIQHIAMIFSPVACIAVRALSYFVAIFENSTYFRSSWRSDVATQSNHHNMRYFKAEKSFLGTGGAAQTCSALCKLEDGLFFSVKSQHVTSDLTTRKVFPILVYA